jgi:C-terminal processing protease CtpA/Prc
MSRIVAAVAISLIVGFAAAVWLLGEGSTRDAPRGTKALPEQPDWSMSIEERLQRLEQIIAEERDARIVLEDQLSALVDEIERVDAERARIISERQPPVKEGEREVRRSVQPSSRNFASMMQSMQERRVNALVAGGFSEDEAHRLMQRESEAQFEALQAAHAAERSGETVDRLSLTDGPQSLLRAELGDSDYERYLEAQGQPTAVQVTQVLASSPGSRAGLQPGDEIVSYNGERVFSVNDLRALTLQGTAGEDVVIEIDRDGVRMQLNVQRGPVGITGTSANIRGPNWWGGT